MNKMNIRDFRLNFYKKIPIQIFLVIFIITGNINAKLYLNLLQNVELLCR